MLSIKNVLAGAAVLAVTATSVFVGGATPAHADVWNCDAVADQGSNSGWAQCNDGFGSYRVVVKCNSAHWPYTRDINGPVRTKNQGEMGPISQVFGQPNGCHVVDAWVQVVT
ncbi:hypothetical protein JOF53_008343 [Crossiella equi]|uniref:Secreted protein n=1 Tax=Crossiella equi TaxID=130796 RepID=A0ABS5ASC8_9PSEU|nr:hypothetical protein [Crossiella equi]MBP2479471.1 hypothetical protein [Crossiella equi]